MSPSQNGVRADASSPHLIIFWKPTVFFLSSFALSEYLGVVVQASLAICSIWCLLGEQSSAHHSALPWLQEPEDAAPRCLAKAQLPASDPPPHPLSPLHNLQQPTRVLIKALHVKYQPLVNWWLIVLSWITHERSGSRLSTRACQPALRNEFGHRFPIKGGWRGLLVSCVKVAVGRAERTRVYNGRDKASLMGVFIQLGGVGDAQSHRRWHTGISKESIGTE